MPKKIVLALVASFVFAGVTRAEIDRDLSKDLANSLTHIGDSLPAVLAGGMILLGNERQEEVGWRTGDALAVTGLATLMLKEMTSQGRPCEPGAVDGFPSGHASTTFAFARAISEEYDGWGKAAYLWAGGVSWSRLRRDDHNFGQVLAGAALGWYLADRSVHSRRGLLNGLIKRYSRMALTPTQTEGTVSPTVVLWQETW